MAGGEGKRRSVDPLHHAAGPQQKHKKLSPIAARALAALESDSSSSESEDENVANGGQQIDSSPPSKKAIPSSLGRMGQSTVEESVIELDDDDSSANNEDEDRGSDGPSNGAAAADVNNRVGFVEAGQKQRAARRAHKTIASSGDKVGRLMAESETAFNSHRADDSVVLPHAPTSKYGDVLSSFLSTAFDDKAMLVLHKSKEGIQLDPRRKSNRDFCKWVSSQRDRVPIVPQMQYRKSTGMSSLESSQDANQMSSAAINAEISSFLVEEGRKLVSSPVPTDDARAMPVEERATLQQHRQPQQQPIQQLPQQQTQQLTYQHTAPHYGHYGYAPQQHAYPPQWNPAYPQNVNGWNYAQQPHAAHAYPAAATPQTYNAAALGMNQPMPAATAAHATATTQRANVVHSPKSQQQPPPHTKPKTASSSAPIKLTSTNKSVIAKLPLAFGFWPDDGASRKDAQSAASEWEAQGKTVAGKNAKQRGNAVCKTPKAASKKHGDGTTPRPKRNPQTPPSVSAGPTFPPGWTVKTFQRTGSTPGKTSTYNVWYSPQKQVKFRSMKGCRTFIDILGEPGVDGNELEAKKLYKERGNKF